VHGRPSGACADSSTEQEFSSDKVYRRDDCRVVGVESFGLQCLAFFVIHTSWDVASVVRVARSCTAASVPGVLTALPSVWSGDPHTDALTVFRRRKAEG
jgi:hypothetical protein